MDKTPKCHPEIAGEGIELNWGKSTYEFRHNTNSGVVKHLRQNAIRSLRPQVSQMVRGAGLFQLLLQRERVGWLQGAGLFNCSFKGRESDS
jgi:hypothetical protein